MPPQKLGHRNKSTVNLFSSNPFTRRFVWTPRSQEEKIKMKLFYLLILGIGAYAWDNDELEIFDLVEEVNSNFYGVLGIEKVSMSDNISFTK